MFPIEMRAFAAPWHNGVEFLVSEKRNDGKRCVGTNITMEVQDEGSMGSRPTLTLPYNAAQVLMDDLWNAGLRPTEGTGSAGSLRATEKHLNDMRKIAGKKIGVDL